MRLASVVSAVVLVCFAGVARADVAGQYVEARTCEVYVGPCFAESEVNLAGSQAVLAWHVTRGSLDGVELSGLSVVAAVEARATLGTPFRNPYPARAIVYVDRRANEAQRAALVRLAKRMTGRLLENVVRVVPARIEFENNGSGVVHVTAGKDVKLTTRQATPEDVKCVSEFIYYEPLVHLNPGFMAVVATQHEFRGKGLRTTWSSPEKRSAFVGTFHLAD